MHAFTESLKSSPPGEMTLLLPHAHQQQPRTQANTRAGPDSAPDQDRERESYETQFNTGKMIQEAYRAHCRRLEQRKADAARKIQTAYRRHLRRKEIVRDRIGTARTHVWHLLRTRSMEMEWPRDSQYYLLFRVPLGYILVCLDTIEAQFESEIKDLRKLKDDANHEDLEEPAETLCRYRCGNADCTLCQMPDEATVNSANGQSH